MSTETREFDSPTKTLGDQIVGLTLLQAKALADYLEEVHGIKPAGGGAVMMAAGPVAAAEKPAEKTEFDVILTAFGEKKLEVIKVIRTITGLGLKEAKDLVEGAPKTVKTGLPKEEAEKIKKELAATGATVDIK